MVDATVGIVTIYNNATVIIGIAAGIISGISGLIHSVFHKSKMADRLDKMTEYLNEAHNFTTQNHDKFVGLVQAATDLSPELKHSLEANGADINKVVADSEQGKAALKRILDEVNALSNIEEDKKA